MISFGKAGFFLAVMAAMHLPVLLFPRLAGASRQFPTRHAVVIYQHDGELERMAGRLIIPVSPPCPFPGLGRHSPIGLAAKIDLTLERVCDLLCLRPPREGRLRIFLLPDGRQVRERHLLFQGPGDFRPAGGGPLAAFFEKRSQSIFLSLADLRPGILAHEMAHFLFSSLQPVPPPHYQEEWAKYVETRL